MTNETRPDEAELKAIKAAEEGYFPEVDYTDPDWIEQAFTGGNDSNE